MPLPPVSGPPDPDGSDCVACGRCCHHGPRTVHLLEADEARMGKRLLDLYTDLETKPPYITPYSPICLIPVARRDASFPARPS